MLRDERALGAVLGSAVGDALGAPFASGAPGAYTARFPDGLGAPHAGGGWDRGEATDGIQMAVLTARSLLERGGLDLPDLFRRFQHWAAACPGSALWALRTTGSYAAAVRAAIDLGGDTDTVAAVTGGLAGAVYGAAAIPRTWLRPLHVPLPGSGDTVLRVPELTALADELVRAGS
ncbi:ADP-ribosylglycohydrolase family protein [Streptomyces chattanoogensis]|uniref:Ribosylglycohydrolase n=1 Tax=Streptomyces chattanoogensis TaxID=66876 RepID=A0A0N0XWA8_9ACTN|nr:ADP-ribosylglycohydrolase family protein [Streptomyces chattanoogensis]KPC61457.1 hypothetical protein ADL29_24665 [Streptomyces chattanoogensis]